MSPIKIKYMNFEIETGVAMPTSTRGGGITKHEKLFNEIAPVLHDLNRVQQSFLIPFTNLAAAEKSRRDYVWMLNKIGKAKGIRFVIAAVDGQPANGDKPATQPGVRIWLAAKDLEPETLELKDYEKKQIGNLFKADNAENGEPKVEVKPKAGAKK
jgi:hypothetical protein